MDSERRISIGSHASSYDENRSPRSPNRGFDSGEQTKELLYNSWPPPAQKSNRPASPSRRSPSPSRSSSAALTRANLSTQFRAERALLAMAQRRVGWEGPELWLVLPTGEVRIGSKLRDLPENEERALAAVRRATGDERVCEVGLLLLHDGCINGPWEPAELRHSREHAVCVTRDALPHDAALPALCPNDLMAALSAYAKRRLQDDRAASGAVADEPVKKVVSPTRHKEVREWSPISGLRVRTISEPEEEAEEEKVAVEEPPPVDDAEHDDDYEEHVEDEEEEDGNEDDPEEEEEEISDDSLRASWVNADDLAYAEAEEELTPRQEEGGAAHDYESFHEQWSDTMQRARNLHAAMQKIGDEVELERSEEAEERERGDEAEEVDIIVDGVVNVVDGELVLEAEEAKEEQPVDLTDDAFLTLPPTEPDAPPHALLEEEQEEEPANDEENRAEPMTPEGVVPAAQLVSEARNAWLQAKDPSNRKATERDRAVLRSPMQRIYMRQEGTDLRDLPEKASPHPAARGKWALQQPVVAPVPQQHQHQPAAARAAAPPKRGGRLKPAEEGGPASIVAPAGHLQRLEQLRQRTVHARNHWQASGALEALRSVASHDDAALSLSVLCSISLPELGAAEVGVALALGRALLVPGATAAASLKPLTALLHRGRHIGTTDRGHAGDHSNAARAAAARASLLRETCGVYERLEELRLMKDASGKSTFDEQFAFGQALALAREAAREAWRALDGEGPQSSQPAMRAAATLQTLEQVLSSSEAAAARAGAAQSGTTTTTGRRAW